jgi:hypothetical protein
VKRTEDGLVATSDAVSIAWLLDEQSLPTPQPDQMQPADVPTATRIIGVLVSR